MNKLTTNSLPAKLERKLLSLIETQKELAELEKDFKAELMEAMEKHDIVSIKNERYTITRAERTSYKADMDLVAAEFVKPALDTAKVSIYKKLYGEAPEHVTESVTPYITWRVKEDK